MDYLHEELIRMSETVLEITFVHDVKITLQDRKSIQKKIEHLDKDFYKKLETKPKITFSFGDKYFCPVKENVLICIPKNADTSNIFKLVKPKIMAKEIEKSYLTFLSNGLLEGYFDIS
jgi:hypothetical protein